MYFRNFVRNNYWFLVMNRKSPCQELDMSEKRRVPKKVVKSKKAEETALPEDSDDERECFINIRKKKLDLMRKNSPQEENSCLHRTHDSVGQSPPSTGSSRDGHHMRAESSQSVSGQASHSDSNLWDDTEVTKKRRLRVKLRPRR